MSFFRNFSITEDLSVRKQTRLAFGGQIVPIRTCSPHFA
jgi:hypothetical protein